MTLHPELQLAVETATQGNLRGLHQMILGPSRSGKTTQAHAYVGALAAKGFERKLVEFNTSDLKFVGDTGKIFAAAKGGAIIIDELEHADSTQRREVLQHIVRAISDGDTLVVLTGAISLENDMEMDPGLSRRMSKPVMLDRQLTRPEMEAFDNARRAEHEAAERERQVRELRAQRVAEWKTAKNEDLQPRQPHSAPGTARFRKPQVTT